MFELAHNIKLEDRCAQLAGVWKLLPIVGVADNRLANNQIFPVPQRLILEGNVRSAVVLQLANFLSCSNS